MRYFLFHCIQTPRKNSNAKILKNGFWKEDPKDVNIVLNLGQRNIAQNLVSFVKRKHKYSNLLSCFCRITSRVKIIQLVFLDVKHVAIKINYITNTFLLRPNDIFYTYA